MKAITLSFGKAPERVSWDRVQPYVHVSAFALASVSNPQPRLGVRMKARTTATQPRSSGGDRAGRAADFIDSIGNSDATIRVAPKHVEVWVLRLPPFCIGVHYADKLVRCWAVCVKDMHYLCVVAHLFQEIVHEMGSCSTNHRNRIKTLSRDVFQHLLRKAPVLSDRIELIVIAVNAMRLDEVPHAVEIGLWADACRNVTQERYDGFVILGDAASYSSE